MLYLSLRKKMLRLLIITSLLTGLGCNDQSGNTGETGTVTSENTNTSETKPADTPPAQITGCYMQVLSRDTFAASLQQQGNTITGKLSFDNFEKDGSTGPVNGRVENGIIKLFYSFASEGMNSVMEVYFKHDNGKLSRGTGDMDNKGDTAYFKDPSSIKYDGGVLQTLPCASVPAKYK